MSLKEWLVDHLPPWLSPLNPWGDRARPEMPDKHALVNKQQALSLRLDRLEAQARWREWRLHMRDERDDD